MKKSHGNFTMMELLIVIAIILILVSLIQPALRQAITSAKLASCLNNLRQIGYGLILFSDDNNGQYPNGNGTAPRRPGISAGLDVQRDVYMGVGIPYGEGYLSDPAALYCAIWDHPFYQYNVNDDQGIDVWARRADALGGFHSDKNNNPWMYALTSYAYRTSIYREHKGNFWHVDQRFDDPGTAVVADLFSRRDILYGQAYGHPNSYNSLYLDNSAKRIEDLGHDYMYTKQPHNDAPRYADMHFCRSMTNRSWGPFIEGIWTEFFDHK